MPMLMDISPVAAVGQHGRVQKPARRMVKRADKYERIRYYA